MKVLFINRDTGCGVEFVGELFINILSHIPQIDSIDIFRSQDYSNNENIDFSIYDFVILNDFYRKLKLDVPTISICFSSNGKDNTSDIIINYNQPFYFHYSDDVRRALNLNFISGNIWENKNDWKDRSNNILYVSRFCELKILHEFLDEVRKTNKIIDFYGPITDEEYYEKYKDVINYKGLINHKELVNVYNDYKCVYLFSSTECLSMTIGESLLCGCVPIIFDDNDFTTYLGDNCIRLRDFVLPPNGYINAIKKVIESNEKYINNYFSFDKMILDFIFYLRALLLVDFKFNKHYNSNIKTIQDRNNKSFLYSNDTINWDRVIL